MCVTVRLCGQQQQGTVCTAADCVQQRSPNRPLHCSYARTSKGNVLEWNRFTREYFAERETLVT